MACPPPRKGTWTYPASLVPDVAGYPASRYRNSTAEYVPPERETPVSRSRPVLRFPSSSLAALPEPLFLRFLAVIWRRVPLGCAAEELFQGGGVTAGDRPRIVGQVLALVMPGTDRTRLDTPPPQG